MHFTKSTLVAMMAALVLAAPTPNKKLAKRSFAVPAKGHHLLPPAEEMFRAYRKHGWEIVFINPTDGSYSPFPPHPSKSAPAFSGGYGSTPSPSSVAAPDAYGSGPSSEPPFPLPSASEPGSGSPAYSDAYGSGPSSEPPFPLPSASETGSDSPAYSEAVPPLSTSLPSYVPAPTGTGTPASSASPPTASNGTSTDDGDSAEVTASPEQNESEYLSPVSIGGQTLNLNFDTGSADLWVFSTELPSSEGTGHSLYDPTKSSGWSELDGATWQIQYGDGSSASGIVGYDQVTIGDATVTKQAVELATEVAAQFLRDENSDGLLGLAFSTLNTVQPQPQKTWFENIQDELDAPVFTADLEDDASGTYEFGTIDHSKYSGELSYVPIDKSNGWWEFPSESITIGGEAHQCTICSTAIADTGTSLVLLDDDQVEAYYSQVQGAEYNAAQGGYAYPCDATLPDIGIAIGDFTATLSGEEITYAEISSGLCFGGIQGNGASTGSGTPVQIIGDVLLKQYFAVFDAGNSQFGIARKN